MTLKNNVPFVTQELYEYTNAQKNNEIPPAVIKHHITYKIFVANGGLCFNKCRNCAKLFAVELCYKTFIPFALIVYI